MKKNKFFKKAKKQISGFIFGNYGSEEEAAINHSNARLLLERDGISSFLKWRDFDEENNILYIDDEHGPAAGFGIEYSPYFFAGSDVEKKLEGIINRCPSGAILQFGVFCSKYVHRYLEAWSHAKLINNKSPIMKLCVERRAEYIVGAATQKYSIMPYERFYPRILRYFLFVKLPFQGDIELKEDIKHWESNNIQLKQSLLGGFKGLNLSAKDLDKEETKDIFKQMLNPQINPATSDLRNMETTDLRDGVMDRDTRIRLDDSGAINFSTADEEPICVAPITIDSYPDILNLSLTGRLIGSIVQNENIPASYYLYTNIYKCDMEKERQSLNIKISALNKQCMSDSQWYRSMMSHIFTRYSDTKNILDYTRAEHTLVRMYSGINVYTTKNLIRKDVEYVTSLWKGFGFKASPEHYIALPAFLSSLPYHYDQAADSPSEGLQRAVMVHSLNAASAVHIHGDWSGTSPFYEREGRVFGGGILAFSGRGNISSIDLFQSETSYNFTVTAQSGGGKSFFTNEIISDLLSKDGLVRVIDVGGSYEATAETHNGQIMAFDPMNPISMNPFWGLRDEAKEQRTNIDGEEDQGEIREMMPLLIKLVYQMAFPNKTEEEIPAWEHRIIDTAIWDTWNEYGEVMETKHLYQYFIDHKDKRANDIGEQLSPYAVGRYKEWFNGPKELSFDKKFVLIEMEQLNQDPILRGIVLTMVVNTITREMYLSGWDVPKLMIIDEAWDLLGDAKSAYFIEEVFRRIRKYFGAAGIITQSFLDYNKSVAAKAAFSNAPWRFILSQDSTSVNYAIAHKMIPDNPQITEVINKVSAQDGYSEVFVVKDGAMGMFKFIVDPHSYYTYTSSPVDKEAIKNMDCSRLEAIDLLGNHKLDKIKETIWL